VEHWLARLADGRLSARKQRNLLQLVRFSLVGGSGVFVNLLTLVVVRRMGPHFDDALLSLGGTGFNLRWYHVYSTIAFLVANVWNFQLNRAWTFRSGGRATWWHEYWPFLAVGLVGQLLGLGLLTLLMHPESWLALPRDVLDDSTGLRTRLYWAQLLVIVVVTPLSFVLNKLWTFAAVRTSRLGLPDEMPPVTPHEPVSDE
jgi:putative flippase GtrA